MTSDNIWRFSTPLLPNVQQFFTDSVRFWGVILDPPTYPKIGRHNWMFPMDIPRWPSDWLKLCISSKREEERKARGLCIYAIKSSFYIWNKFCLVFPNIISPAKQCSQSKRWKVEQIALWTAKLIFRVLSRLHRARHGLICSCRTVVPILQSCTTRYRFCFLDLLHRVRLFFLFW